MTRLAEQVLALKTKAQGLGRRESERAHEVYPDGLTPREVEVLRLLATGRTNREIAADLIIGLTTVDRHISNLYAKIGARGRADAAAYAVRHGLVQADPG